MNKSNKRLSKATALVASAVFFSGVGALEAQQSVRICGTVLDESGKVMPMARISSTGMLDSSGAADDAEQTESSMEGRFCVNATPIKGRVLLSVLSKDGERGTYLIKALPNWEEGDLQDIVLQTTPLCRIRFVFGSATPDRRGTITVRDRPTGFPLGSAIWGSDETQVQLPPGSYQVKFDGEATRAIEDVLILDGDREKAVSPTFFATPSQGAKLPEGAQVPEWMFTNTNELATSKPTVKSFQGKWLLIEFWTYWCGPCVARAIPELLEFDRNWKTAHGGETPEYAVVLLHARDADSFEGLQEEIDHRGLRRFWENKDLPFPILVDAYGATADTLGITGFPTGIVVDPNGRMAGTGGLNLLRECMSKGPPAQTKEEANDDPDWIGYGVSSVKDTLSEINSPSFSNYQKWLRSRFLNPRDVYVDRATRVTFDDATTDVMTPVRALSATIQRTRMNEFKESVAHGMIQPISIETVSVEQRAAFVEARRDYEGMEENIALASFLNARGDIDIVRYSEGKAWGVANSALPKSWAMEKDLVALRKEAIGKIVEWCVKHDMLTRSEAQMCVLDVASRLSR